VCFTHGADCTRCHGRNTLPGVLWGCRGSRAEGAVYAAGLALWQRRLAAQAEAMIVPSRFALERLGELRAPVGRVHVIPQMVRSATTAPATRDGGYALITSRLAPEKGIEVAIEACRRAGMPLIVAGAGPERSRLEAIGGSEVRFLGQLEETELAGLRAAATVALMPSRSAETFGLAAAEAMAAGLPVIASRIGALPELVPEDWLVPPGDAGALAAAIGRIGTDRGAGARAIASARAVASPEAIAPVLARVYG
jgi:glycosyltransferase involved in cell wall biosynthesis